MRVLQTDNADRIFFLEIRSNSAPADENGPFQDQEIIPRVAL